MHLYSTNLSAIATICSSIKVDIPQACFSCSNSFKLLQSCFGSEDQNVVFDSLRDPAMIARD